MKYTEPFQLRTEAERRQAVSLTQAALSRVSEAVGEDVYFEPTDKRVRNLLSRFRLHDNLEIFKYVQEHFKEEDVRAILEVDSKNETRIYTHLHCLEKAILLNPPNAKRGIRFRLG